MAHWRLPAIWWQWALVGLTVILGLSYLFESRATHEIDSFEECAIAGQPVTEGNPPTCRDGKHVFRGPAEKPAPSQAPATLQAFDRLVEGDSRGSYPRRQEHIQSEKDWQRYWREVHAGASPMPPIIAVDFTKYDVVTFSMGRQQTDGYRLKVNSIVVGESGSVIDATESTPTITCKVAPTPTNRYVIVRTAKLHGPVSFRVSSLYRKC